MDKSTTRMIEDTAENLAKVAGIGREGWHKLAEEIDQQPDADEIWAQLADLQEERGSED